ncbi:MAG TPA: hypothetical protein VKZ50_02015 [bacterium]|nr:hypothetical protein [bacterium]
MPVEPTGVMAMGPTRIRYSPELEEAVVEQAFGQPFSATKPPGERTMPTTSQPLAAPDPQSEERGTVSRGTHASVFQQTIYDAVREAVAVLADRFAEVVVSRAWAASEEGAEVSENQSTLGLKILPMRFADPLGLQRFLRHEFGHVTDILDVTFGYGTEALDDLAATRALRKRSRLLWCCSIDGRIASAGAAPLHTQEDYEAEFVRLFPGLPSVLAETTVGALWNGERPPYSSLMRMAAELV